jgi:hypothetical protein
MSSCPDDCEVATGPDEFGNEAGVVEPVGLVVGTVGEIRDPVDLDLRVLGAIGDDDVSRGRTRRALARRC